MQYTDIYKVNNLVTWLEAQNPNDQYNYNSCKNCLLAQYLRHNIPEFVSIGLEWWDKKGNRYTIPNFRKLNDIAYCGEWTFGKALERARIALGNQEREENSDMRHGDVAHRELHTLN